MKKNEDVKLMTGDDKGTTDSMDKQVEVVDQPTGKWVGRVVDVSTAGAASVVDVDTVADEVAKNFKPALHDGPGLTPLLRDTEREIVGLMIIRHGVNPDDPLRAKPDHADDLLPAAVQCILDNSGLINESTHGMLTPEILKTAAANQTAVAEDTMTLRTYAPLIQGLTVHKVSAQVDLAAFCKEFYDNGGDRAIKASYTLGENMQPLLDYLTAATKAAEESKQHDAALRHKTEAATLDRVKGAIAEQTPHSAGAPQTSIPVAAAPGAPPITLPEPIHPKPKRKASASGPKPAPKAR